MHKAYANHIAGMGQEALRNARQQIEFAYSDANRLIEERPQHRRKLERIKSILATADQELSALIVEELNNAA